MRARAVGKKNGSYITTKIVFTGSPRHKCGFQCGPAVAVLLSTFVTN